MSMEQTSSGRIWTQAIATVVEDGKTALRFHLGAVERLSRDKMQCCQQCDLVVDRQEAQDLVVLLQQWIAEVEGK